MKACYYTIVLLPREASKLEEEQRAISGWGSLAIASQLASQFRHALAFKHIHKDIFEYFLVNCGAYFLKYGIHYIFLVNCGAIFFGKLWDIFKYFWQFEGLYFLKLWDTFKYFLVNCGAIFLVNYGIYLNIFW